MKRFIKRIYQRHLYNIPPNIRFNYKLKNWEHGNWVGNKALSLIFLLMVVKHMDKIWFLIPLWIYSLLRSDERWYGRDDMKDWSDEVHPAAVIGGWVANIFMLIVLIVL